jgi:hypothetical protein
MSWKGKTDAHKGFAGWVLKISSLMRRVFYRHFHNRSTAALECC